MLKQSVLDHWESEVCGTRYGTAQDLAEWFLQIEQTRYLLEPHIHQFVQFGQYARQSILELGVGAGTDFVNFLRHGAHAAGVDFTESALQVTAQRLSLEQIPSNQYALARADVEDLPFKDNTFDLVYAWGVLHHTPDTHRAFQETHRVLKPSGTFKAMVYHVPSWVGWMLWVRHCLGRFRPWWSPRKAIFHYLESPGTKAYTVNEVRHMAAVLGFADIKVRPYLSAGDLLLVQPSGRYRSPLYRMVWRLFPRPIIKALGHRWGTELLIEATKSPSG